MQPLFHFPVLEIAQVRNSIENVILGRCMRHPEYGVSFADRGLFLAFFGDVGFFHFRNNIIHF